MSDQFTSSPFVYPQGSFYQDIMARLVALEAAFGTGAGIPADLSITTFKLAAQAVTAAKIANDTITAAQIAPNAIGSSELADTAVDTAAIQALAVTKAKLNADVFATPAQAITGTAADIAVTPTALTSVLSNAAGAFRMKLAADFTTLGTSVVATKLNLNSAPLDTGGNCDIVGFKATPVAGLWLLGATLQTTGTVAGLLTGSIYVNGALVAAVSAPYAVTTAHNVTFAIPTLLNGTDFVELYVTMSAATGTKVVLSSNTMLWGARLS